MSDLDQLLTVDQLLTQQAGVLTVASAHALLGPGAVRWRLSSGRWLRPAPRVLVAQSGPLTRLQHQWVGLLHAGPGAVLGRETAASLDGLRGYESDLVHVIVPSGRHVPRLRGLVVHRSTALTDLDVHPLRIPPRTRLPRSVVDAARYADNDDRAAALLLGAVQQRLTRPQALRDVLDRLACARRRRLLLETVTDAAGGSHSLPEMQFVRLLRRHGLPAPERQAVHLDSRGRRRYLDADWDRYSTCVEIDGGAHVEVGSWWLDMDRHNDELFDDKRMLRFPAHAVRQQPQRVAARIEGALRKGGWTGLCRFLSSGQQETTQT